MRRHFSAFEKSVLELKNWRPSNCNRKQIVIKNYNLTVAKEDDGRIIFVFQHAAPHACRDALMDVFRNIPHDEDVEFDELDGGNLKDIHCWDVGKYFYARSQYKFSNNKNDILVHLGEKDFVLYFNIRNTQQYKKFAFFVYMILSMVFECIDNNQFHTDSIFVLQKYFPDVLVRLICCY